MYENKIEEIYDDVSEKIKYKYNEENLTKTNFYYYNIQKNREEFQKDIQIQKQYDIAENNLMPNTQRILS